MSSFFNFNEMLVPSEGFKKRSSRSRTCYGEHVRTQSPKHVTSRRDVELWDEHARRHIERMLIECSLGVYAVLRKTREYTHQLSFSPI